MNTVLLLSPRRKTIIELKKQLVLLGKTMAAVIIAEETRIHGTIVAGYVQSRDTVIDASGIIRKIRAENLLIINQRSKPMIIDEALAEYTITIGIKAPIIIHHLETKRLLISRSLVSSLRTEDMIVLQQATIKSFMNPVKTIIIKSPIARFHENPASDKTHIKYKYKPLRNDPSKPQADESREE